MIQEGFVVECTGSWYKVEIEGAVYDCRTRGKLRLKGVRSTSPVVVGDRVGVEFSEEGDGVIVSIAQLHHTPSLQSLQGEPYHSRQHRLCSGGCHDCSPRHGSRICG